MDEVFKKLNEMSQSSKMIREIGNDSINIANKMDDYLMFTMNPVRMCLSDNIEKDLDKKAADINLHMMILLNKLAVLGNHLDNMQNKNGFEISNPFFLMYLIKFIVRV